MRKRIYIDDFLKTGERTVQVINPNKANLWAADRFYKIAEEIKQPVTSDYLNKVQKHLEDLDRYFKTLKSVVNHSILHIIAMTGGEFYGPNKNGDAFYWEGDEGLTKHAPGFTSQANVFQHHQNKDPSKSIGQILNTFINDPMKRIELVIMVDHDKCPDVAEKLASGKMPAWSMGCKIKYDVCDICDNKAKTREDYCKHAQEMLGMHEDGRLNFVWNPSPYLFDISEVYRPADRVAFTLKKVAYSMPTQITSSAELGAREELLEKRAKMLRKLSEIVKAIKGETVKSTPITDAEAKLLKSVPLGGKVAQESLNKLMPRYSLTDITDALEKKGTHLTLAEYTSALLTSSGMTISPRVKTALANMALNQDVIYEALADYPWILDSVVDDVTEKTSSEFNDPYLDLALMAVASNRSYLNKAVITKLAQEIGEEDPGFKTLHVINPETGQVYATNTAAARDANEDANHFRWAKTIGGAALLGLGHKYIHARPGGKFLAPIATSALAYPIMSRAWDKGPMYQTQEGPTISARTPLVEKSGFDTSINLPTLFTTRDELVHASVLPRVKAIKLADINLALEQTCSDPDNIDVESFCSKLGHLLFS